MGNLEWKSQATLLDAWGKSSLSKFFRCCQSSDTSAGCSCGQLKFPTLSPWSFSRCSLNLLYLLVSIFLFFPIQRKSGVKWGKATISLLFIYFLFITRSTKISHVNNRKQTKPQTTPLLYIYLIEVIARTIIIVVIIICNAVSSGIRIRVLVPNQNSISIRISSYEIYL